MKKAFLVARKVGIGGTAILETTRKQAISVMRLNRGKAYQIAILGGPNYDTVRKVYGEYSPFRRVNTVDELIKDVESNE